MDGYGKFHYVRADALASEARTLLRRHSPITGRAYGFEDEPKQSAQLHRANICTHGKAGFVVVEAMGERWRNCPVCIPGEARAS